jgi:hypothetical protein
VDASLKRFPFVLEMYETASPMFRGVHRLARSALPVAVEQQRFQYIWVVAPSIEVEGLEERET